jgi:putative endopeptidase
LPADKILVGGLIRSRYGCKKAVVKEYGKNGTDDFYSTFDVKEGDAMYIAPENRTTLW